MRLMILVVCLMVAAGAIAQNENAVTRQMQTATGATTTKPKPDDKNADGSPRYKSYEDYIEALVDWKIEIRLKELRQRNQTPYPVLQAPANVSLPSSPCSLAIDSQIDGDFNGWDGETIYRLQNGQIWRQSSYHYHYHYAYSPHVLIFDSGTGCKMTVRGDDDEPIQVERLR